MKESTEDIQFEFEAFVYKNHFFVLIFAIALFVLMFWAPFNWIIEYFFTWEQIHNYPLMKQLRIYALISITITTLYIRVLNMIYKRRIVCSIDKTIKLY